MLVHKLLSLITMLSLAGCSNDDSNHGERPEPEPDRTEFALCEKDALESDMKTSIELSGPGVNPQTGELAPGDYHVATTYLALQPGKLDTALELSGPVIDGVFALPGFVAMTIAGSTACNTLRTLTVWKSEESMFGFVASPAHVRAMAETGTISRGSSNSIAWDGSAGTVSWQEAARRLGMEEGGDI